MAATLFLALLLPLEVAGVMTQRGALAVLAAGVAHPLPGEPVQSAKEIMGLAGRAKTRGEVEGGLDRLVLLALHPVAHMEVLGVRGLCGVMAFATPQAGAAARIRLMAAAQDSINLLLAAQAATVT
jgi:hypothetical protein